MITSLSAFMAANAKGTENKKVVVSPRFTNEDGSPIEWELCPLSAAENNKLRETHQKRVPMPGKAGKRGQMMMQTDLNAYLADLIAKTVIFPDLTNAELQDSYRVMGEKALIEAMLTPGEYDALLESVQEINGFDAEAAVEEAKN